MKSYLLLLSILFLAVLLFSCASTASEEGGAPRDDGLDGDGENPFASPSSLTANLSVGGISMMLPPGSYAGRTKEGNTIVIQDEEGEEIGLLYEIRKLQGVTAKTAAKFMKRTIRSETEEPVTELSFQVHGFPAYGLLREEKEILMMFVDLHKRIQVCEFQGRYREIIPYIRIMDYPVSYRHRRNFLFNSLNSFWRWYSDFHEGAILYRQDSFGGLFAAITVSDEPVENPFSPDGMSAAPSYTGKIVYFINHTEAPMDYEIFPAGEGAVLAMKSDVTDPPVYAFFHIPSLGGSASQELPENPVFQDLFFLNLKLGKASGPASPGTPLPVTFEEVR